MDQDFITVAGRVDPGYGVCIDSAESWIVAVNNGGPDSDPARVTFLGAHPNTDEVFVVVNGRACLVSAPPDDPENFTVQAMLTGVCYNVRRNTWHTVLMRPGAKVVICENRNPAGNRHDLSPEARERMMRKAEAVLDG